MPTQRARKKTDDARPPKVQRKAAPKPAAARPRAIAAAPQAASPELLRQIQRQVGNRALTNMLASRQVQAKLTVGPAGDRYEQEADHMADAVMRSAAAPALDPDQSTAPIQRMSAGPVGLEGGDAGEQIESRLAANKGGGAPLPAATRAKMETGLNADFGQVRVHTGSESQALNQAMGAQAFTHGPDVYMGAGKYSPNSSAGQRLLAHELTHVVQQGASTVRRRPEGAPEIAPDQDGVNGVIRRKLSGTTAAILQIGGDPSLRSRGKAALSSVTSSLFGSSNSTEGSGKYAQIIRSLTAYERTEARYLAKNQATLSSKEKGELFGELKNMELLIVAWLSENDALEADPVKAKEAVQRGNADELLSEESVGQQRFHALRLLLPRLRHEQMEVVQGKFYQTGMFSDKTLDKSKTVDDAFGGAVNRLDQVVHQGQTGVFTQDKTVSESLTVGTSLGASVADPNSGARSVAMYQLAQLLDLGVNVIAKTEFATHTSATNKQGNPLSSPIAKLGVRQEMVSGAEAAKTPTAISAQEAEDQGGDTISLEDPTLQRSLNALQLIDAIAGQVDRHWHNYYIATDKQGAVTGVIGIDLDMAFAPDHKTVAPATELGVDPLRGSHFVGMPKLVDSAFAKRIVTVSPKEVSDLLRNYLKPEEVSATLERFRLVQEACAGILKRKEAILPTAWGEATAQEQLGDSPNSSYLGKMAAGTTKHDFVLPAETNTMSKIKEYGATKEIKLQIAELEPLIWSKALTSPEALALVDVIHANYLSVEENQRESLIKTLRSTPISTWNNILHRPAANPGVLLKAKTQLGY